MRRKANLVRDIRLDFAELFSPVDKGASGNAQYRPRIVLVKRAPEAGMPMLPEAAQAVLANLPEDQRQVLEAAFAQMAAAAATPPMAPAPAAPAAPMAPAAPAPAAPMPMAQQGGAAPATPEQKQDPEEETDMSKAELTKVAGALEKAEAENVELRKRLDALEDAEATHKWLEKTRKDFPHGVPGMNQEKLAALLKSASASMDEEAFKALEEQLRASAAIMAQSELLKEFGAAGDGTSAPKSASAELAKKAAELVASEPGLEPAQAETRVLAADVDLKKRVRAEERKRAGLELVG